MADSTTSFTGDWPEGCRDARHHRENSSWDRRPSPLVSASAKHWAAVAAASSEADTPMCSWVPGWVAYSILNTDARYVCISSREMYPSPSKSKSMKAEWTLSTASPPHRMDRPLVSSVKSTYPLWSASNTSNRWASTKEVRGLRSVWVPRTMVRNTWSKDAREMRPSSSTSGAKYSTRSDTL